VRPRQSKPWPTPGGATTCTSPPPEYRPQHGCHSAGTRRSRPDPRGRHSGLDIAASVDEEAGEIWDRFQRQRRAGLHEFAVALARKTAHVRYDDTMTDMLWMLTPDV
jgi:hypothetical protein